MMGTPGPLCLEGGALTTVPAGRGGASIYGKQFEDELHPELKFTGERSPNPAFTKPAPKKK